jgi:ribosomal protein S18 acetylase RimI-like enzyme
MAAPKRPGTGRTGRPARAAEPTHPTRASRRSPPTPTASPRKSKGPGKPRGKAGAEPAPMIEVRRIHRRDLNRVWEFLKISLRTTSTSRPSSTSGRGSKKRFVKTYDEEGVDQLVFEVGDQIVAYAECAHEVVGTDNWINESYFERRKMRPLFVEELAVHPDWNGRGVGGFVLEQLHHLAKVRGLSHLVLEVAENNEHALAWYRKRGFRKLDAAIFLAASVDTEDELLPPKPVSGPLPAPPLAEAPIPPDEG